MSVFLLVLLILAALFLLLLLLPVRAVISYDECGFSAVIRFLFLRFRFPRMKKQELSETGQQTSNEGGNRRGSYQDLISLLRLAIRSVGKLLKVIRIRSLKVDATIASHDPFQTAMMFGTSGAGVGILLPLIEKHFRLKQKTINVNASFEETESKVFLIADCSVVLFQLLAIVLIFAYNFWKEQKMKLSSQRKDGNNGRAKSE